MSLAEQLDNVLEQYEWYLQEVDNGQEMPEEVKPRFEVTDKDSASWVLRKIAKIEAAKTENRHLAAQQIEPLMTEVQQIQDWTCTENNKLDKQIEFLKSLLYPYHKKVLADDPKAKTIKLPHGELKMRSQQPEFVRDDDRLVSFLVENGLSQYVKVKTSPNWADFKRSTVVDNGKVIHKDSGQVVEGVEVQEKPEKFEVTVKW